MVRSAVVRWVVVAVAALLVVTGCVVAADRSGRHVDVSHFGAAPFTAHGSVDQVWLTGARAGPAAAPHRRAGPTDPEGDRRRPGQPHLPRGTRGEWLPGRRGERHGTPGTVSAPIEVKRPERRARRHRSTRRSRSAPGTGTSRPRDGTLLSMNVTLPGPPTRVRTRRSSSTRDTRRRIRTLRNRARSWRARSGSRPSASTSAAPAARAARSSSSNRSSGPTATTSIEAIAAQPWVAHGKVGMVGISYPGISQLFTAAMRPPHLAAIAPLSVISDTGAARCGRVASSTTASRCRGRATDSTTRRPRPRAVRPGRAIASVPATRRVWRIRRCAVRRRTCCR